MLETFITCCSVSVLMVLFPIALTILYRNIDKTFSDKLKLSNINILTFVILDILYIISVLKLCNFTNKLIIVNALILGYLLFMSIMDIRTKLLYDSTSYLMIVANIIILLTELNNIAFIGYNYIAILVIIILWIMSRFNLIGFGDVLIYVVLAIHYFTFSVEPFVSIILNILITNILFIIASIIIKIVNKNKNKHLPLTPYIFISTFLCSIIIG